MSDECKATVTAVLPIYDLAQVSASDASMGATDAAADEVTPTYI